MNFDRVPMQYRPVLEEARKLLPDAVAKIIQPHYLIGFSPRFVGLHSHEMTELGAEYGEVRNEFTYDDCAHAFGVENGAEWPTVVFPRPGLYGDQVGTLLHEIGHLWDSATGRYVDVPVTTEYSRTNRRERIAEAFEIILKPPSGLWDAYVSSEAFRPMKVAMGLA